MKKIAIDEKKPGLSMLVFTGLVFFCVTLLVLPVLAAGDISASREISNKNVKPGDTFTVSVCITSNQDGLDSPVLDEDLPDGWILTRVSDNSDDCVEFRTSTAEWFWSSFFQRGRSKTIVYNVTVPSAPKSGIYFINGYFSVIDSEGQRRVVLVEGDSQISLSGSLNSGTGGGGGGGGGAGGGGAGGGGGGSPEQPSNIEFKELSQQFISNGQNVTFIFPQGVTCISYVKFDARKTIGKITTIAEMLKSQSSLVTSLPAGKIYKNINIWVGSGGIANPDNIENALVGFWIDKGWLEENEVDPASVSLCYYNKGWNELATRKVNEDDAYVYFEAETVDFASFVILAKDIESDASASQEIELFPVVPDIEQGNTPVSKSKNPVEDSKPFSLPGVGSVLTLGILGVVSCVLKRRI